MPILDKKSIKRYDRPEDYLSTKEIRAEYGSMNNWYATWIRFVANQWGVGYDSSYHFNQESQSRAKKGYDNEVQRGQMNFSYYWGEQDIQSYSHMMQDIRGNKLPHPYHKGDDIYDLIEHRRGGFNDLLSSARHTVKSLEPSVRSERSKTISRLQLKKVLPEFFAAQADRGYEYLPEGERGISPDEAMRKAAKDPGDQLERLGMDLLDDFLNKNRVKEQFSEGFLHADVNRCFGIHVHVMNGRLVTDFEPSWSLIHDPAMTDSVGTGSQFRGTCKYKPLSQVIHERELTSTEIDLLKKVCQGGAPAKDWSDGLQANTSFQPRSHLNWVGNEKGTQFVAEATSYWYAHGKDGVTRLYGGTLLGGVVLVDFGEQNNLVFTKDDPDLPVNPLMICYPNYMGGRSKCTVDRAIKLQERIDAYETKKDELIARAKGKLTVFKGTHMAKEDTVDAISANLDQTGIHVSGFRPIDEMGLLSGSKMTESIDFTMDGQALVTLEGMLREKRELMKLGGNTSSIAMGQQSSYVANQTQQTTIGQNSLGNRSMIDNIIQTYVDVCWYALNKMSVLYLDPDMKSEAEGVLDKYGKDFLHLIKRFQTEELQTEVTIMDVVDHNDKSRLDNALLGFIQNAAETGFTHAMYLQLIQARTYSELVDLAADHANQIAADKKASEEQRIAAEQFAREADLARNKDMVQTKAVAGAEANVMEEAAKKSMEQEA